MRQKFGKKHELPWKKKMIINKSIKGIQIVLDNYQKIIKKIVLVLTYVIVITGISYLITFPIWFIATKYSKTFSVLIIGVLSLLIIFTLVKKSHKWFVFKKGSGLSTLNILLIPVKNFTVFLIFLLFFYFIIILFSKKLIILSIILSLGYLLALGSYIFIFKKKNANTFS